MPPLNTRLSNIMLLEVPIASISESKLPCSVLKSLNEVSEGVGGVVLHDRTYALTMVFLLSL